MKKGIIASCCLMLMWFGVTAAGQNEAKSPDAKFKNISWNERREWVESITPSPYWKEQAKRGCIAPVLGVPTMMVGDRPLPVLGSYVGDLYLNYGLKKASVNYHNALADAMAKGGPTIKFCICPSICLKGLLTGKRRRPRPKNTCAGIRMCIFSCGYGLL